MYSKVDNYKMFLDVDTRRRAASDLVRGLCKFHEQRVIEIFSGHVVAMLQVTNILCFGFRV